MNRLKNKGVIMTAGIPVTELQKRTELESNHAMRWRTGLFGQWTGPLILMLTLQASNAAAGSYSFSGMPENEAAPSTAICQDFIENLKRLGNPPMVCDRKFHSSMKQFTWPRWKPIDAIKHRDLVEQIWQNEIGWARDENLRTSFEAKARSGDIQLSVTQIPIDGFPMTVLRFINGDKSNPCKSEDWDSTYPLRQYFVVDRKLQKIDFTATYKSVLKGNFSYSKEMRPDLFLHKGKPYTAFWDTKGKGRGIIEIFGDSSNYCHINFAANNEEIKK